QNRWTATKPHFAAGLFRAQSDRFDHSAFRRTRKSRATLHDACPFSRDQSATAQHFARILAFITPQPANLIPQAAAANFASPAITSTYLFQAFPTAFALSRFAPNSN